MENKANHHKNDSEKEWFRNTFQYQIKDKNGHLTKIILR